MSLKKSSETMDSFFQRIKEIMDKLGAVAVCINEEEFIHLALEGSFKVDFLTNIHLV